MQSCPDDDASASISTVLDSYLVEQTVEKGTFSFLFGVIIMIEFFLFLAMAVVERRIEIHLVIARNILCRCLIARPSRQEPSNRIVPVPNSLHALEKNSHQLTLVANTIVPSCHSPYSQSRV